MIRKAPEDVRCTDTKTSYEGNLRSIGSTLSSPPISSRVLVNPPAATSHHIVLPDDDETSDVGSSVSSSVERTPTDAPAALAEAPRALPTAPSAIYGVSPYGYPLRPASFISSPAVVGCGVLTLQSAGHKQQQQQQQQQQQHQSHQEKLLVQHRLAPASSCPLLNVLVIGGPQSGKSTFTNAYRSVVCQSDDWPSAPTGICGLFGTASLDVLPNSSVRPTWALLDTPGRVYESTDDDDDDDSLLLHLLVSGLPAKTKLVGPGAQTLSDLTHVDPCPANKARQCIIVVSAREVIEDIGLKAAWLGWQPRYVAGPNAGRVVAYLQRLVMRVRHLLGDVAPFIVVTHMDEFGGASCPASRAALLHVLQKCLASERIYFVGCPPSAPHLLHAGRKKVGDVDGGKELRKLHREILSCSKWRLALDQK